MPNYKIKLFVYTAILFQDTASSSSSVAGVHRVVCPLLQLQQAIMHEDPTGLSELYLSKQTRNKVNNEKI